GDRGGVRAGPGGQPPSPTRPREVRHVPGTPRAAGAYPERRLGPRAPSARDPHLGGQGPPAGGRHAAGADLRAGLPGLLARLPLRAVGAPGAGLLPEPADGLSGWLGLGGGYPEVLRHSGSWPPADVSPASGA